MALEIPYPDDVKAPFGYDEDGVTPKAPLGYKSDGNPRISNRGRKAGSVGTTPRRTSSTRRKGGRSDAQRRDMLTMLADMWITTPLAALSKSDALAKRIGEKQTDALAADAVIVDHFKEGLADGLIELSKSKPSVLAWMDTVEEKAPWIMLATVGVQVAKAVVENHLNPSKEMANYGRQLAQVKAAKFAADIEAEAQSMGVKDAA